MDTLVTVSIMTLVLFVSSGSARAATLIVSNQMQKRANIPVFVTCHGSIPKMSKSIPVGQVSLIKTPTPSGQNATDDIPPTAGNNDKPARSRASQRTSCVGTFGGEAHFWPTEMMYSLYDSDTDTAVCLVVAKADGFYLWSSDKNYWHKAPVISFI